MSTAIGSTSKGRPHLVVARLGDWALFLIFATLGTLRAVNAIRLGMDDDFFGAAHLAVVAIVIFVFGFLFVLRGPAAKRGGGLLPKLTALVGTWSVILLAALPLSWRPDLVLNLTTFGLIAAYCWVIWSALTLRRNLSIYPEARELVRDGPYALVRHPLYSAHIVCYVLIALPRLSLWAVLIVTFGVAGELLRARYEERLLCSVFSEYAAYAASTPRFVPRLLRRRSSAVSLNATSLAAIESS